MKYLISIFFAALICNFAVAQTIKATTEDGEKVLLKSDGTWKYAGEEESEKKTVTKVDGGTFKKAEGADYQLKGKKIDYSIWIDKSKWKYTKSGAGEDSEYEFTLLDDDVFGMVIAEKTEIQIDYLVEIAIENAQDVDPEIEVVRQETRLVNGKEVQLMQMEGTIKGMKIVYLGYYYSSENGSIQLLTYTTRALYKKNKAEMENFLNGLVVN